MEEYIIKKLRGKLISIELSNYQMVDSYSSVKVREYYINELGLRAPYKVDSKLTPDLYNKLESLINEINLFKPRANVPNRKFISDVTRPGDISKLIRKSDLSRITLCFRSMNKETGYRDECRGSSPNTCFISESESWDCYKTFYSEPGYNGEVHYIDRTHPNWEYWFRYMDKEYERLTGIKVEREVKRSFPNSDIGKFSKCLLSYSETVRGSDLEILKELSSAGLCRINEKQTSLYDKDGYWICRLEELLEKDREGIMIKSILRNLTNSELSIANTIIDRYIKVPDEDLSILGYINLPR